MRRKNKKYSQGFIDSVHNMRESGSSLKAVCKKHKLTLHQLKYVLYARSPAETVPQKHHGSAPPSKIGLWDKVKLMLGF